MNDLTVKTLTPEQIKNWRDILVSVIGPYALIVPEDQIEKIRGQFQKRAGWINQKEPTNE